MELFISVQHHFSGLTYYIFFAIRVHNYYVIRQAETMKWCAVSSIQSIHRVAFLKENVPNFIEPNVLPSNSPGLNPLDYAVWGALQQLQYRHKIQDIVRLKKCYAAAGT